MFFVSAQIETPTIVSNSSFSRRYQAKDTFGMWERQSCTRSRGRTARVHGTSGEAARAVDASGPAPTPRVGLSFPHVQAGLHTVHGPLKRALDSPRPAATGNGPRCTFLHAILRSKCMRDVTEHVGMPISALATA